MANEKIDVTDLDLVITKIEKRTSSGGAWVRGKINNAVRFEALVFAEHAESEDYELGRTKISKLWIQDIQTKKTLFNFDRGLDIPAATTEIQVLSTSSDAGWPTWSGDPKPKSRRDRDRRSVVRAA